MIQTAFEMWMSRFLLLFALLQLTVPSIQSFGTSESTLNHRKPSKLWILFFRNKQKETTFFGNSLELQDILSDNPSSTMHQLPITTQSTSIRYRGGYCEEIITPSAEPASIWQTASRRLVTLANVASLLCVIDCTVLPIVTILFPLLGMAAPGQMEWLHEFGHSVAIYFVLPVGGTAATMNYISHKKMKLSIPALVGLLLIYAANAHDGWLLSLIPHEVLHTIHSGIWHRVVNIGGCAMLLASNYVSHRQGACRDARCKVTH